MDVRPNLEGRTQQVWPGPAHRRRRDSDTGVESNARLTADTTAVLLGLLAVLGILVLGPSAQYRHF